MTFSTFLIVFDLATFVTSTCLVVSLYASIIRNIIADFFIEILLCKWPSFTGYSTYSVNQLFLSLFPFTSLWSSSFWGCLFFYQSLLLSVISVFLRLLLQMLTLASRRRNGRRRPRWSWRNGMPGRMSSWRKPKPITGTVVNDSQRIETGWKINKNERRLWGYVSYPGLKRM